MANLGQILSWPKKDK